MKRLFPSLPDTPDLGDTFKSFPGAAGLILQLSDDILLRDSDLSIGERELIAAYVSGLNACSYCLDSHKVAADAFGVDPAVIDALLNDPDTAEVDARLHPILRYGHAQK